MKKIILFLFALCALSLQAQTLTTAKTKWTVIKNETAKGANTATRIGLAGEDIVTGVRDTLATIAANNASLQVFPLNTDADVNYIETKLYVNNQATTKKINGTAGIYTLLSTAGTGLGAGTAFQIAGADSGLYFRKTSTGELTGNFIKLVDSLSLQNNILKNISYGCIFVADSEISQAVSGGIIYTKITAFDELGLSYKATTAADSITATIDGVYEITCNVSLSSGTANIDAFGAVFVNGFEQENIHFERKISAASDVGSTSISGFVHLNAGDVVDFRMRHENISSVYITIHYANLNIKLVKAD